MYQLTIKDGERAVSLSASLVNVDRFCGEMRRLMDTKGLERHHFAVQLLVREALNNAVIHGCRNDRTKVIDTVLVIDDDTLTLEVADPGEGFKWKEYMERGNDDLAHFGRGLEIFRAYATEFYYNANGTRLTLKMKLS